MWISKDCYFFIIITLLSMLSLYLIIMNRLTTNQINDERALLQKIASQSSEYKSILYWNDFFMDKDFYLGSGYLAHHCPVYNKCFATYNRLVKKVEDFDAIVFHGIYPEVHLNDLPSKRKLTQTYIFMGNESPVYRKVQSNFNGYYNITMSHHLDSDVVWPYGIIVERDDESSVVAPSKNDIEWKTEPAREYDQKKEDNQLSAIIKGKKKLAIWYRSNCDAHSNRQEYIKELGKHMEVTSHGKCSQTIGCTNHRTCFKKVVEPDYFFYLSFENSLCDDYVTEKLFYALKVNVIPVVYGGANYSRFAPPKSYINALDFDSPKELADYLIKLSKDPIEYRKYFDWKRRYRSISPRQRIICDLCEMLYTNREKKTYEISKWYDTRRCSVQSRLTKQISQGGLKYATRKTLLS